MSVKSIEDLNLPIIEFKKGEKIIEAGKLGNEIFVLQEGVIIVESSGIEICKCDVKGTLYGEVSALLGSESIADVISLSDTKFYHITDAQEYMKKETILTYNIAELLAGRLTQMNRNFIELNKHVDKATKKKLISDEILGKMNKFMIMTNRFFDRDVTDPFDSKKKKETENLIDGVDTEPAAESNS